MAQSSHPTHGSQPQRSGKSKKKTNDDDWANANNNEWGAGVSNDYGEYNYAGGDGEDAGYSAEEGWRNETNPTDWGIDPAQGWAGGETTAYGRVPKVTVTSPSAVGSRAVLSPGQQQQLLNALHNHSVKSSPMAPSANPQPHGAHWQEQERGRSGGKKSKKHKKQQQEQYLEPMPEESHGWEDEGKANKWSSNFGSSWGGRAYSMPSKIFALATDGQGNPSGLGPRGSPYMETRFIDSQGDALMAAEAALYSQERLAKNRIHWLFSPLKDPRVATLLEWIELMSEGLAYYGVSQKVCCTHMHSLTSNSVASFPAL